MQYRAGSISGLDLAQSRQTLASQEAALTTYVQQRVEQRHALSILFDAPPESLPEAAQHPRLPALAALPAIPAGVPADVLGRRPDLQAAEMRLRESLANVDATRTSYYNTMRQNGVMCADDIRELEDMNPIPNGLGKIYFINGNMLPLENAKLNAPKSAQAKGAPLKNE